MHPGSRAVAWTEAQSQPASTQILDKHKQFQHCWARYTVALSLAKNTDIQNRFQVLLRLGFLASSQSPPSVHKNRTRAGTAKI